MPPVEERTSITESTEEITGSIDGAQAVLDWFGCWPSFHDAEIVELHLSRRGPSRLRILNWRVNWQVVEDGYYRREKEAVVTFVFDRITDLKLEDFSQQNVIFGLRIEKSEGGIRLILAPCYGISGFIEAAAVSVEVAPGGAGDV